MTVRVNAHISKIMRTPIKLDTHGCVRDIRKQSNLLVPEDLAPCLHARRYQVYCCLSHNKFFLVL